MSAVSRPFDIEDDELDEVELAELLAPSVDWLCAASSAFMVSGAICGGLPEPTNEVVMLPVLLSIANGLVAPCEDPPFCVDPAFCVDEDDFEFVSDWIASSALDTAPRANSIAQLQPTRHAAANVLSGKVSKRPASAKSSMKSAATAPWTAREHRQFMPVAAEISAHRKHACPALPATEAHVRRGPIFFRPPRETAP
ncbi:hypothetical protein ABIF60_003206 [Bradyrhizobium japonicum]